MPIAKKVTPKIELEPGVFLVGECVHFEREHMVWPLPRPGIDAHLRHLEDSDDPRRGIISRESACVAATILSAYERLLFDSREKRQRVIRCLRKALEVRT